MGEDKLTIKSGDLQVAINETEDPEPKFKKGCNPLPDEPCPDIQGGDPPTPTLDAPCGLFDPSDDEDEGEYSRVSRRHR